MSRPLPSILVASLLAASLLGGCSGDDGPTTVPLPRGKVIGRVTDAAGQPVAGAQVALDFGIEGIGWPGWDKALRADDVYSISTIDTGRVRLEIQDYLHQTVHVFMDEVVPPGTYEFTWDLNDDEGAPVPTGGYWLRGSFWSDPEGSPLVRQNFLLYHVTERAELWDRNRTVTDADGRYEIDLAWFPVGEAVQTDDYGTKNVSHLVRFVALEQVADSLRTAERMVTIDDRQAGVRVDLQMP